MSDPAKKACVPKDCGPFMGFCDDVCDCIFCPIPGNNGTTLCCKVHTAFTYAVEALNPMHWYNVAMNYIEEWIMTIVTEIEAILPILAIIGISVAALYFMSYMGGIMSFMRIVAGVR